MSDPAIELKRQGNRAYASRDYETAKVAFQNLIRATPDSPIGYVGLAKTLFSSDEEEAVIELLEPIISTVRSNQLLKLLGDAYRVLVWKDKPQYLDQAIKYYETYHREKKEPVTLFYLAELYQKYKKDISRALNSYQESWDHDPYSREAYLGVIACLKKLDRPEQIEKATSVWRERSASLAGPD